MKKIVFLIGIFLVLVNLQAREGIRAVKILKYNKDYNFIVIDQGEIHGMKAGMDFSVIKDGVQIGKIEVVKVRDNVCACDIKELISPDSIKEGDVITIYPLKEEIQISKPLPPKEQKLEEKPKVIRKGFWESLAAPFRKMFREEGEVVGEGKGELEVIREIEGPKVSIDVYATRDITFYVLKELLEEHKVIITHSNRLKGTMVGFKMAKMGIAEEIFADIRGLKEKKLVYEIEVEETGPKTSKINISLKLITYGKETRIKPIERGREFRELNKILSKAKTKAEQMQERIGG